MAIINITLDTNRGDTLQGALHALMTTARLEFPKYPEPRPEIEPNPFNKNENNQSEVVLGKGPNGEALVDFQPSTVKTVVGSVTTQGPDPDAKFPEPSLSAMDGDRKRGEPGAGHRRRTNAQIAEDEVYFKQRGHAAVATMELGAEPPETRTQTSDPLSSRSDAATTQSSSESAGESQISSGEARTNPDDDAQDAADEAAESAAHRGDAPTLDDLRKVIGEYQKKFGMAQAAAKTLEYTGCPIFEVPSKDIPLVIARWQAAIEHDKAGEAAKFTPVRTESGVVQSSPIIEGKNYTQAHAIPVVATREQVNAAINDYATKFDGSLEPAKMVNTKTDIPKLMERLFGAGKNNFNAIERTPENYGRVIAAIQAEIGNNTFGRTAR